jgi:lipopolysaccharide/colanic/teichoic acid biosynthesis glycosyltransferase
MFFMQRCRLSNFVKKTTARTGLDGIQKRPSIEALEIPCEQLMEEMSYKEYKKNPMSLDYSLVDECFLSPDEFRIQLRREKRRVERSSAPLSVILFQLNDSVLSNKFQLKNFLDSIKNRTRETDIKGWVDSKTIGAMLPDTDGDGMKKCLSSITRGISPQLCSIINGSYPDSLFEELLDDSKTAPGFSPFDLDQITTGRSAAHFFKRCLDLFGSLVGLILFLPLMVLTAVAIKISSPGPVIFRQTRLGRGGKRFSFYKFRSMYVENDDRCHREFVAGLIEGKHELLNQGEKNRPVFKIINDHRITPVGRAIRRLSIDELPQFFNVLKGEMSLVGPRPPIPYEVERYKPWHLRRILEIKPGITGLWQVDGRSRTSFDEMVRLDLQYLMIWSFWLDLKILLKTIKAVIGTKGAV